MNMKLKNVSIELMDMNSVGQLCPEGHSCIKIYMKKEDREIVYWRCEPCNYSRTMDVRKRTIIPSYIKYCSWPVNYNINNINKS